jgi:hypothetical protein
MTITKSLMAHLTSSNYSKSLVINPKRKRLKSRKRKNMSPKSVYGKELRVSSVISVHVKVLARHLQKRRSRCKRKRKSNIRSK